MAQAFTVTDNANGTGAQVTVTGTDPSSTNTVLIALSDRTDKGYVATTFTRTGDGAIQVTLGDPSVTPVDGVNLTHAWMVNVSNSEVGGIFADAQVVTPTWGMLSPHFQAICVVQRYFINENIRGQETNYIGGKVYRCEEPESFFKDMQPFSGILLYPPPTGEGRKAQNNLMTLWTFPIQVGLVDRDASFFRGMEGHMYQRWLAMSQIDRLTAQMRPILFGNGQPGCIRRITVAPGPIFDQQAAKYQWFHSTFTLQCECDRVIGPTIGN